MFHKIIAWKTVFIIDTPYLPFRNLILTHILFGLSDYPHRLSLASFNFNQNHISINGIIFNIPFKSLKIFRFRCLPLAENVVAEFFLFQIFLADVSSSSYLSLFCLFLAIHRPPIYNLSEVWICTIFPFQILFIDLASFRTDSPFLFLNSTREYNFEF